MKQINLLNSYFVLVCFLCLFSINSLANSSPEQHIQNAELAELIQSRMLMGKVPALAVSIKFNDKFQRFIYGFSDLQKQNENTADTVYEIGSMSKAFTGLAIQILAEQGKLSLNDDIRQYLPNLTLLYQDRPVKLDIEDFLYHTSGLPFSTLSYLEIPSSHTVEQQLQGVNLKFKPKSRYFYASANYDVLGAVIEKVTGQSYRHAIATLITQPFGMSDTVAVSDGEQIVNKAKGYKVRFGYPIELDAPIAHNHVPSAYIHSTLTDMEKWMDRLLYANKVTPILRRAIDQSLQGNLDVPVNGDNHILYASGWFIEQRQGTYINHGGQNPNFSSCLALRPDEQIGIVALANINTNIILQLCSDIDSYLHNQQYRDDVKDLILFIDFIFSILSTILLIMIIVVGVRMGIRIYRYRRRNGMLILSYRDCLIVLLAPLVIAGIFYVIPGFFFAVNWHFTLLWLPSTLSVVLIYIVILTILLTLNHRIKKKISLNEELNND
ncbi:serine hydrolase domain-containing protein [Gilliamella sp. App4-10]|uniref:serine hydrolase domain-containing protein n=1 Tax=Gilliamella sp. App4-10 TaxID=3120231 RepID=UPI00080E1FE1|nr:serine hydrolase domain-containing protein [Gilliamella apicola]OCG21789.1 hypothetical protein A9G23_04235 [Gilliamella apicola]